MDKEVVLVFDALRDPRDFAQMIHLALAANTKIFLCGASLDYMHPKVINIIDSWLPGYKEKPKTKLITTFQSLEKCVSFLRKKGFEIIGTSSLFGENLFSTDLSKGKTAIVFGTETSGLSEAKLKLMDKMLSVKMLNGTKFFTLPVIAPVFAYEALKQKKLV